MIAEMFDLQRERMKHMLTTAILDMWKKETGSLSSVVIEGTVCISSASGRTVVIQMADKFNGVIPEAKLDFRGDLMTHVGPQSMFSGSPYPYPPHVDTRPSPAQMAAYMDDLSPASLVSPCTDYSHSSGRDSRPPSAAHRNSVGSAMEDSAMEVSPIRIKEEVLSDESGCDVSGDDPTEKRSSPSSGPVCGGTGYYTCSRSPTAGDPASPDGSLTGELQIVENINDQPTSSTPKSGDDSSKQDDSGTGDSLVKDALDLTTKDSDLALSPPQSYTAQVRDVIRQRLLAGRQAMTKNEAENLSQPATERASTNSSSTSSFYPVMLQSLGKPGPDRKPVSMVNTFHPYKVPGGGVVITSSGHAPLRNHALLTSLSSSYPPAGKSPAAAAAAYSGPLHNMLAMRTQTPSPSPSNPENSTTGDQKIYKCDYCAKTFLFKSKYHEHLPVHTNARPFQCHMCSRTYKYKYDLRVHLRTHMGIPTKSTICPFCASKYDSNKQLRQHIKEAHGDRPKMMEQESPPPSENTPPADLQGNKSKGVEQKRSLENMPVFPGSFPVERPKSAELKSSLENMPVFPGSFQVERPKSAEIKMMQPSENLPVFPGNFGREAVPYFEGAKVPESSSDNASLSGRNSPTEVAAAVAPKAATPQLAQPKEAAVPASS